MAVVCGFVRRITNCDRRNHVRTTPFSIFVALIYRWQPYKIPRLLSLENVNFQVRLE